MFNEGAGLIVHCGPTVLGWALCAAKATVLRASNFVELMLVIGVSCASVTLQIRPHVSRESVAEMLCEACT